MGALIDPLTGDLLFTSTPFVFGFFPGDGKLFVIRGFVPPNPVPEPTQRRAVLAGPSVPDISRTHSTMSTQMCVFVSVSKILLDYLALMPLTNMRSGTG